MPAPCRACRAHYPRKLLLPLYDIPQYAERPFYRFCPACCQRLRQEHAWDGILDDERRTVVAQLNRAMAARLPATLTLSEWIGTLNRCNWRCFYCQNAPYEALEHFVPIALGGGTTVDNCLPACKSCNSSKGMRHPDDIRESSRSPAAIARARAYLSAQRQPATVAVETAGTLLVGELPAAGAPDKSL